MTYDRERVKMTEGRMVRAAKKLYEPPPKLTVLAATSEKEPQTWRFTTTKPDAEWMKSDFGDSTWKTGPGGFGTEGTPRAVVRTVWNTPDIWLRRSFDIESLPEDGELMLTIHHDEDAEVYLNGELIQKLSDHTRHYRPMLLGEKARKLLRKGRNTIAVHCHQTTGGQYIDVGMMGIDER